MTPEDIERLQLEDLQRMANDPQTSVPDDLPARLQEMACAASLTKMGTEALADKPGTPASRRHLRRWLWGTVPAVALASLAIALLVNRHPQGAFNDPAVAQAYSDLERAFGAISESLGTGMDALMVSLDAFHQPFDPSPSTDE